MGSAQPYAKNTPADTFRLSVMFGYVSLEELVERETRNSLLSWALMVLICLVVG